MFYWVLSSQLELKLLPICSTFSLLPACAHVSLPTQSIMHLQSVLCQPFRLPACLLVCLFDSLFVSPLAHCTTLYHSVCPLPAVEDTHCLWSSWLCVCVHAPVCVCIRAAVTVDVKCSEWEAGRKHWVENATTHSLFPTVSYYATKNNNH